MRDERKRCDKVTDPAWKLCSVPVLPDWYLGCYLAFCYDDAAVWTTLDCFDGQ